MSNNRTNCSLCRPVHRSTCLCPVFFSQLWAILDNSEDASMGTQKGARKRSLKSLKGTFFIFRVTGSVHIVISISTLWVILVPSISDNWTKRSDNPKLVPKDCESMNAEPLLLRYSDAPVSECFTFPSLHIMLGITNKLVQELESRCERRLFWQNL